VIGERIAEHPDVDLVSFTGSTGVGARVAELAGRSVKKVALELGGKSANVILEGADLATGQGRVGNAFLNGGQTCMAWTACWSRPPDTARRWNWSRQQSRATPSGTRGIGTRIGPSASASQYQTVRGFIERPNVTARGC